MACTALRCCGGFYGSMACTALRCCGGSYGLYCLKVLWRVLWFYGLQMQRLTVCCMVTRGERAMMSRQKPIAPTQDCR